jgi:hypothetical protein
MGRLPLFQKALDETESLHRAYPDVQTLQSIANQIKYLISLATGASTDRSRLREIILGVQAAREIEPLNRDLADLLYRVDEEAKRM